MALYEYNVTNLGASFDMADGSIIAVRFDDLTSDIKHQLMVHGLKQKVADAAAIPRNTETGRSASIEDKIAAMRAVADRLAAGQWNATREGGAGNTGGLLLRALMQLQPHKGRDEIAAWLKGKSKAEQAALRASPKVAPIIDSLRAAASGGIDSDDLLAELDD